MFRNTKVGVAIIILLIVIGAFFLWQNKVNEVAVNIKTTEQEYSKKDRETTGLVLNSQLQEKAKTIYGNNPTIPYKAISILVYLRHYGESPKSYEGGRQFFNREKRLPKKTNTNKNIKYREWDVNPRIKGKNRGAERLVTSNTSAYYTRDHYQTFEEIFE